MSAISAGRAFFRNHAAVANRGSGGEMVDGLMKSSLQWCARLQRRTGRRAARTRAPLNRGSARVYALCPKPHPVARRLQCRAALDLWADRTEYSNPSCQGAWGPELDIKSLFNFDDFELLKMQTLLGANGQIAVELARELQRNYTRGLRLVSRSPRKVNDTDIPGASQPARCAANGRSDRGQPHRLLHRGAVARHAAVRACPCATTP